MRVEVATLAGAVHGVPRLLRLFGEYGVSASFFFCLGPDTSGRALLQPFGPRRRHLGLLRRMGAAGLRSLAFGTLRPAPLLGRAARELIGTVAAAGHEVALGAWSQLNWLEAAALADPAWTEEQFTLSIALYEELFGGPPGAFAAPGWQVNPTQLELEGRHGLRYASDVRGQTAFLPELCGTRSRCMQLPTTLPTLDELRARADVSDARLHEFLFAESQRPRPQGHVWSLSAEREGFALIDVVERLLVMWKGSHWEFHTLAQLARNVDPATLVVHRLGWARVEGRPGHVAMQALPVEA